MTFPIRNLRDAENRLNQYQMDDRPLNVEECRELRDLLTNLRVSAAPVMQFMSTQRRPPHISLAVTNLINIIG